MLRGSSASLAMHLLLNSSRLLCLPCRGLHVLPARLGRHGLSSQTRHLLEVRTIMFWTLSICIPLLLSWGFGVRPCMHTATSFLDLGRGDSGTHLTPSHPHSHSVDPFSHLVEHLLEHLHQLPFAAAWSHWVTRGTLRHLQQHLILVRLPVAMLFCHGSLGPNHWLFSAWVLGSQSFPHVLLARVSSTTSNDFNANFSFRITSYRSIRGTSSSLTSQVFRNTRASQENRNHHLQEHILASRHHLPRTPGMSTTMSMH